MKRLWYALLAFLLLQATPTNIWAQKGPTYANGETEKIVANMLAAHGGTSVWEKAKVVSFDHILYMPSMPAGFPHWMISKEVFDQQTGRAIVDHPLWHAEIVNNGERIWSVNWQFPNPPQQMIGIHYYFAFLPWLTLQNGVKLSEVGKATLPERDTEYLTVSMGWDAPDSDTWTLYLHPDTYRMEGFGVRQSVHTIDSYTTVDGMLFPNDWTTRLQGKVIGFHALINVNMAAEFDEQRMKMPEGAKVAG